MEKSEAGKVVQMQQGKIQQLSAIIRNAPKEPASGVVVTTAYKNACDSLPAEIDKLNIALADKDTSINGIIDLYNYEIQIRDEELFKEMNYSDSLKVDFVRQTKLLRSALQQGKPRGRLLGGISILGNQNQFLSGAGVVIAYQTKGGKQYQLSPKFIKVPGATGAEVFYEGAVLFTIFK
jgi:archaellin